MQLRADARANRSRILDVATEAFAERGLHTEMKVIAERAGVAIGTLYNHFESKDDLLLAIVREAVHAAVAGAQRAEAEPDALLALRGMLANAFEVADRYGWIVEALLTGQLPPSCQTALQADAGDPQHATRYERIVARCIAQGRLRADLDVVLSAAILQGATLPWVYRRFRREQWPLAAASAVVDLVLSGAAPR
jgi:AcrR family transcriptional regulator